MASLRSKVEQFLGREFSHEEVFITKAYETDFEFRIVKWDAKDESNNPIAQPSQEQLDALDAAATIAETNKNVRRTRRIAYGAIGDQLDLLYKDLVAGKVDATGEWAIHIKAIKDANSKL